MFTKIGPQKVQHSEGFTVEVADRYSVQYSDQHYRARIEVDFGPNDIGVYLGTLTVVDRNLKGIILSHVEREDIVSRILLGLREMGSRAELLP